MTRAFLPALALSGILATGGALAQAPSAPPAATTPAETAPAETVLSLAESAEVLRAPDEIRATLRVEARGANAAAVQSQVNGIMAKALEQARSVREVQASTGGYWTHRDNGKNNWTASQALTLRGNAPGPLLELAGALQEQGLVMGGLDWSLSRPQEIAARQEAGRMAIEALRERAEAVAGQLGMRVVNLRSLRLDAATQPVPRMAMAMMAARQDKAAPPPVSAPDAVPVSATATAEFVLRP
ncbi:MAG TPA: SIMPL domain-containing protein [Roseomonas sp.]|nr:SIMPL domain-containing protein [Roseomonas sp.]